MAIAENLDLLAIVLFLGGWLALVARDIRDKVNRADPLAVFLFMLGSITLCVLQFFRSKPLFIVLGLAIAALSILNWYYVPHRFAKLEKEIVASEKKLIKKK